jgi:serine/threonine protein kinase
MATVYLAHHAEFGKVALKVLHQHLVKRPEVLHRFWREMRLSDKLDHPRIVRVLDAGVEGDRFYLAMVLVEGPSLFEFEREKGPLPVKVAVRLMKTILDAISHAHQAGMIHRDLKPENILLDFADAAYVSDFGIAKHLEGTQLTQTGTAVGTPYYMAPEQIRNAKSVGPEADIYSLGILFYEMVTGAVPFNAKDPMAVAHHHIHGTPVAPSCLRKDLPPLLERIILKAMEKKPEHRFPSAARMLKALEFAEAGKSAGIKLVGPVEYRRSRWKTPLLILLLLVVPGLFFWQRPDLFGQLASEVSGLMEGGKHAENLSGEATKVEVPAALPEATPASTRSARRGTPSPNQVPELLKERRWDLARMAVHLGGVRSERYIDMWMEQLRQLLDKREVAEARKAVTEFRAAYPTVLWGPFMEGEVALAEGNQGAAAASFSEGFRLSPPEKVEGFFDRYRPSLRELNLEARTLLKAQLRRVAVMRQEVGVVDEALMLLRQSSKIYETPDTHLLIAEIYQRQGFDEKAHWHRKRAEVLARKTP